MAPSSLSWLDRERGMSTLLSLSIVCLIFAIGLGAATWLVYRHQLELTSWPTTQGVILSSELRHTTAETADRRYQLAWQPFVKYQYRVNGETFVGHRISTRQYSEFARSIDTPPTAKLRVVLLRYPVGAQVIVHFNPEHPDFAVIEIDRAGTVYFGSVAAACGVLGMGFLAAWMLKRLR
jgi:Protein of unknown function (DUF3592)